VGCWEEDSEGLERAYTRKSCAVASETRRLSDCEQTMAAQPYRQMEDKQQLLLEDADMIEMTEDESDNVQTKQIEMILEEKEELRGKKGRAT
jgi:hypothetical protein